MPLKPRSELARLRVAAGFDTALEGAARLGCSRIHLLNCERGASKPGPSLIQKMAKVYGKSVKSLNDMVKSAQRDMLRRQLEGLE